jgi:phosphatidylglycerophosphate synthase
MGTRMLPPAGEARRTILWLMVVVVVSLFVVLLVEGFTAIEALVMLAVVSAVAGIEYLIYKSLWDYYKQ